MKRAIIVTAVLMQGCANVTGIPCFAEVGVGTDLRTPQRAQNVDLVGDVPGALNLYCEKDNWTFGYYHDSYLDIGKPFNDDKEMFSDRLMINYRVQIN